MQAHVPRTRPDSTRLQLTRAWLTIIWPPSRSPVCRGSHRWTGRRGAGVGRGTLLDAKDRLCLGPVAFERVIVALRGREDVHDDAAEVEQDPVRRGGPLAADRANAVGPQPVHDPVADRLQLAL